ncbi:nose resistant to fluoxetine protein 6-like [Rhopalosiphum maidis]|uniref:nose resistant to fluoxetine protein 6-like n=1 Tax=Rhopalosiphum maidis TaxID=43146 RepID=UPI000EFE4BA0|nr:nose resistant to fluoxetine protein 6-like [Rhopalosiphum maidis]XP_026804540.1 nose resistant to fluoxetine protein 6-like [Rhopalosiphum maidis]XP_026804541.1 nose resistant to fluoxetine protein 6-like [Rhopalosiphum maidis]
MWLEYIWIALTATVVITNKSVSHAQSHNASESKTTRHLGNDVVQKLHDDTLNTKNITPIIDNENKINTKTLFGDIIANSMNNFLPFSNANENCTKDGRHFVNDLNNQTLWAVKMYTSSSKYPGSILSGDVNELGYFDQCMRVSSKRLGINGAYAIANVRFHLAADEEPPGPLDQFDIIKADRERSKRDPLEVGPENLLWGLCFPDSCTNEDIRLSVDRALAPAFQAHNISVKVAVSPLMYTSKNTTLKYTNAVLIIYGIFIVGCALMIAGTLYDIFTDHSKPGKCSFTSKCLNSFSVITNMRNLTEDPKTKDFAVTNGLKTLGIISVIIGHRVALNLGIPSSDPEYSEHIFTDFWWSFLKSPVAVEIFFVISGFFTYVVIEERLRNRKPLKFIFLMIYRIIRIFPMYITVIAIFAFILPYMGDGPLWKLIVYPEAEFCRKNWWTNLLFINNYVHSNEMCMVHAWYLACDMHFFIVGIFLTYIIWRWNKAGIVIYGILFAISIYIPAKSIYDNKQWGVMPYFHGNIKSLRTTEHFQKVYIKSHYRITTYLVGLAAAFIYLRIKQSKLKFSLESRIIGFMTCLLLHIACYIVTGYLYLPGLTYNPWNHIIYFTFQRIVYSLTISYLLVVSSLSNFGFISSFIECKLFTVISRLSYVLYLTHFIVQLQSIGQIRQPQYGNFWTLYWEINADLITALSYSIFFNLIVEAPCRKIFKELMNVFLKAEKESDSTES